MNYYEVEKIYPWLYRIGEPLGVFFYLVVGNDKALLFDTGHGIGDIPELIKSITSKPVIVVLGHGHIDHASGAYQFDEAYLHENDFDVCRMHTSPTFRNDIINSLAEKGMKPHEEIETFRTVGMGNLKKLDVNTVFDLGGLRLKVIEMPGHTTGSIGLLIVEKRTLLVSDSASGHIWMFLKESTTIKQYIKMLERVSELEFDTFLTAHSKESYQKSYFQKYINVAGNASIEKSVPYDAFKEFNPYIYKEDDVAIVINVETLE